MKKFGDGDEGSVVPHLSVTVGGKAIFVPPSVYSRLFDIMWASLGYKDGTFDLTINEGVDLSLVHIYFGGVVESRDLPSTTTYPIHRLKMQPSSVGSFLDRYSLNSGGSPLLIAALTFFIRHSRSPKSRGSIGA